MVVLHLRYLGLEEFLVDGAPPLDPSQQSKWYMPYLFLSRAHCLWKGQRTNKLTRRHRMRLHAYSIIRSKSGNIARKLTYSGRNPEVPWPSVCNGQTIANGLPDYNPARLFREVRKSVLLDVPEHYLTCLKARLYCMRQDQFSTLWEFVHAVCWTRWRLAASGILVEDAVIKEVFRRALLPYIGDAGTTRDLGWYVDKMMVLAFQPDGK